MCGLHMTRLATWQDGGKPELNHANSREPSEGQLVVIHRLEVVLAEDLLELLLDVPAKCKTAKGG